VKTTVSGTSTLEIANAASGAATLRVARIGEFVITLIRPEGEAWRVHRRFRRADLPGEMQVGLTTYTDWASVEVLTPEEHNTALITGGNPDLLALIDYVRYAVPEVPAALRGRDLADPGAVPDAELLTFLG